VILDYNKLQVSGFLRDVMPVEPVDRKWRAFNWEVVAIDGHDIPAILEALETGKKSDGRPVIIIADTVKGKGVSFMEGSPSWHAKVITREEYDRALTELGHE
jgi:transketolase